MRILAIDPGFERMGIAVLEKDPQGKEKLIFSSCFKTPAKDPFPDRLAALGTEVARVIKEFSPEGLAVETLLFSKNQKTALMVSEARGVIIYEARKAGLKIFEYNPGSIKVAVTGYGKATKDQVEFMATKLAGVTHKIAHDDEADAIAVGLTCLAIERF